MDFLRKVIGIFFFGAIFTIGYVLVQGPGGVYEFGDENMPLFIMTGGQAILSALLVIVICLFASARLQAREREQQLAMEWERQRAAAAEERARREAITRERAEAAREEPDRRD